MDVIQTLVPFIATDSWSSIVMNFNVMSDNILDKILDMFLAYNRFDPSVHHNLLLKRMTRSKNERMIRRLMSDPRVVAEETIVA